MTSARTFRIHLGPQVLEAARAGKHNFLNRVTETLNICGYQVEYRDNSFVERVVSGSQPGWTMFEMEPPEGERSLVFRRAYIAPFWQIDRTDKRWDWTVASNEFRVDAKDRAQAQQFADYWRRTIYKGATETVARDGSVFVPLQSRICEKRPFQAAAPIDMLKAVLRRWPGRKVIATLHPKITYSTEEAAALGELARENAALTVDRCEAAELLSKCDLVVTENSAAAFEALFFRKPVLLFAGIDFHHAFASVWRDGEEAGFDAVEAKVPDYDAYLWWYLQRQSLNAGRDEFRVRLMVRLGELGVDLLVE